LERGGGGEVLPAGEESGDDSSGCGCSGVAEVGGARVSDEGESAVAACDGAFVEGAARPGQEIVASSLNTPRRLRHVCPLRVRALMPINLVFPFSSNDAPFCKFIRKAWYLRTALIQIVFQLGQVL